MKIGFFEIIPGEDAFFKASLPEDELIFSAEPLDQSNIPNFTGVEIISTHTNSKINSTVIENLKSLKLICTRTTGFDHIDTKTRTILPFLPLSLPVITITLSPFFNFIY
jgi:D-lactate dehydrogenase